MRKKKVKFGYETTKLSYEVPVRKALYTPDFVLGNGIILEVKGRLTSVDRRKMRLVVASNPNLDIRFVFQRPFNPIYKGSETTYADWAVEYGFKWCGPEIPESWLN